MNIYQNCHLDLWVNVGKIYMEQLGMIAQQPGSIRAPVVDTPWNPPRHGMDTNLLKNPANNAFTGMFMNICMNFWYKLMYQICRLKWYIGGFGQQEIHQKEKFHWFISFSFPILTGVIQASPHCWAPTKPASCRLNNGILRALYKYWWSGNTCLAS